MNNCENCTHWRPAEAKGLIAGKVGECRAGPPVSSYSWPRTRAGDGCSQHSGVARFAAAAAKRPKAAQLDLGA